MKINEMEVRVLHNEDIKREGYYIETNPDHITIQVSSYPGFVYALETLYQIVKEGDRFAIGVV